MGLFNKKKETSKNNEQKKNPFEKTAEDRKFEEQNSFLFRESEDVPDEEIEYDYEALGIEEDDDEDFIEDEDDLLRRFGKRKKSGNLELQMKIDEELLQEQTYAQWDQHVNSLENTPDDYLADLEYFEKGGVK